MEVNLCTLNFRHHSICNKNYELLIFTFSFVFLFNFKLLSFVFVFDIRVFKFIILMTSSFIAYYEYVFYLISYK